VRSVTGELDLNAWLDAESLSFAAAIGQAKATARVPTCPEWQASDLLWHLGEVQDFWATILVEGMTDHAQVEQIGPDRPDDWDGLMRFFDSARLKLVSALSAVTDDSTPAWTWSTDQTVGFIRRRQAHEALIHRVDAELVADRRTPMSPILSADGVDEVLRVMYGGAPAWGIFSPDGRTIRLDATDVNRSWRVALGRFSGDDPDSGPVDEADIRVLDDAGSDASAQMSGTAADLDCWLWHRPSIGDIEQTGDAETLESFTSVVAFPIN
jgi:uncharacterized protein (TIGR03083 family)